MSREQHAGYITSLTMSPWLSSAFGKNAARDIRAVILSNNQ
jgi:hypothetical protein